MNVSRQLLLKSVPEGRETHPVSAQGTHATFFRVRWCRKASFAAMNSCGNQLSRGAVNFEKDTFFSCFHTTSSSNFQSFQILWSWFSFERLNPSKRSKYKNRMELICRLDQCNYAFHTPKPKMDGCGIFKRDLELISLVMKQGTHTGPYWRKWTSEREMCKALKTSCDQKPWAKAMAQPLSRQTSGPVLVSWPREKKSIREGYIRPTLCQSIDGLMPLWGHTYCCGKDMLSWIVQKHAQDENILKMK